MRKIYFVFALPLVMLFLLASCTSEREGTEAKRGEDYSVRLNITNGVKNQTRASATLGEARGDTTAFDREKNIDNLWAVVFKKQKDGTTYEFYKTFKVTEKDGDDYKFDMENGGLYYMYVVANTSHNLQTTTGISVPEDLFQLIENSSGLKDPGADCQANKFLMVSKQIQVDIDGFAENNISVELTRAAARIDVDASRLSGFNITSVEFKNRYKTSYIARGTKGTDMTDASLVKETKTYTASALTSVSTNTADVVDGVSTDGDIWRGILYGYENLLTSSDPDETTVLTIHADYNGRTITRDVVFDNIPLERNHLYNIDLIPLEKPTTYAGVSYTIKVRDWETGKDLEWIGDSLTKSKVPDFQVSGTGVSSYGGINKKNPTNVVALTGERDVILTVTGNVTGATLSCADLTSDKGYIVKESVSNDKSGNIVQTFRIHLESGALDGVNLNFVLSNALDATQKREFVISSRPRLPLEYVALGDIKVGTADSENGWEIDPTSDTGYGFDWSIVNSNTFKNGFEYFYTDGTEVVKVAAHVPSTDEWRGIFYCPLNSDLQDIPDNTTSEWTHTAKVGDIQFTSVKSTYTSKNSRNNSNVTQTIYSIMFQNALWTGNTVASNLYRCAYRYTLSGTDNCDYIECTYLGEGESPAITDIAVDSWWTGREIVKRKFKWYKLGSGTLNTVSTNNDTYYWSIDGTSARIASEDLRPEANVQSYYQPIRPFANE